MGFYVTWVGQCQSRLYFFYQVLLLLTTLNSIDCFQDQYCFQVWYEFSNSLLLVGCPCERLKKKSKKSRGHPNCWWIWILNWYLHSEFFFQYGFRWLFVFFCENVSNKVHMVSHLVYRECQVTLRHADCLHRWRSDAKIERETRGAVTALQYYLSRFGNLGAVLTRTPYIWDPPICYFEKLICSVISNKGEFIQ